MGVRLKFTNTAITGKDEVTEFGNVEHSSEDAD